MALLGFSGTCNSKPQISNTMTIYYTFTFLFVTISMNFACKNINKKLQVKKTTETQPDVLVNWLH